MGGMASSSEESLMGIICATDRPPFFLSHLSSLAFQLSPDCLALISRICYPYIALVNCRDPMKG